MIIHATQLYQEIVHAAIDTVIDKIARQMRKYKTRLLKRHRPRKEEMRQLEETILQAEPFAEERHTHQEGRGAELEP